MSDHPYREMPKKEPRDVDLLRKQDYTIRCGGSQYFSKSVVRSEIIYELLRVLDRLEARIAQLEDELRKK